MSYFANTYLNPFFLKKITLSITFFFSLFVALGQDISCVMFEKEHVDEVLILGYSHFKEQFFQIGIGSVRGDVVPPKRGGRYLAAGPYWNSVSMSVEVRLFDSLVFGPQLSYWSNALFEVIDINWLMYGMHLIAYTNASDGALIARPEIGLVKFFEFLPFKGGFANVVYGYNIPILNQTFGGYNTHNLSLRFYLKYH